MKIDFDSRKFKWLTETTVSNPVGGNLTIAPSIVLNSPHPVDPCSAEGELYRGYTTSGEDGQSMKTEREIKNWMAGGTTALFTCLRKLEGLFMEDSRPLSREALEPKLRAAGIHPQTFEVAIERLIADGYVSKDSKGFLTMAKNWSSPPPSREI